MNALFSTVLLGGLAFGRPLLSVVLDSMFSLTEEGEPHPVLTGQAA